MTSAGGDIGIFDRVAPVYDRLKPATDRAKLAPGLDLATRDVRWVLDVGGGSGQGLRTLRADGTSGAVVDAAPGMVARAHRRGLPAVRGDATRLPVRDGSVDAVLVLDALHHMPDPAAVVAETARVLAPGGVLVVLEYDPTTVRGRLLVAGEHLLGMDSAFFAPGDLLALLRGAGLTASIPRAGFEYTAAGVK